MGCRDGSGVLRGGFFQGSLGQVIEETGQAVAGAQEQGQGGGIKGVGVDANLLQARLDIACQLLRRPGTEMEAKAQAGQEGRINAHLQAGQELFVTDQQ